MKWVIIDVNMFHCSVLWLCHSSWRFPDKTMKSASVNLELPNSGRSNPKSDLKILYFLKMCPIFVGTVHNFGYTVLISTICIRSFMPDSIKKSVAVSNSQLTPRPEICDVYHFENSAIVAIKSNDFKFYKCQVTQYFFYLKTRLAFSVLLLQLDFQSNSN